MTPKCENCNKDQDDCKCFTYKELEAQVSAANLKLAEADKGTRFFKGERNALWDSRAQTLTKLKIAVKALEALAANYGDRYSAQEALEKIKGVK